MMKKIQLVLLTALMSSVGFSQNAFIVSTQLNTVADQITASGLNVTNDTVEYYNASELNTLVASLLVVNTTASPKTVKVKRTVLSAVSGSSSFFCWDLCYPPSVSISTGTVTIAANDTAIIFSGDYEPSGNAGTSYIKYRFYNNLDTSESASVIVKYTAGSVGIEDEKIVVSKVYPNPAADFITFDYNTAGNEGSITITDITGKVVKSLNVPANTNKQIVSLDGLTNGIYIYAFYVNGKVVTTKKIVVKK